MSEAQGFNPLRWDCREHGCFNWKKRPKIELFACCLPGKIGFGDIDAITEIYGNALLLEWKSTPQPLATGQRLMYDRVTDDGRFTVLLLAGDAKTMNVTHRAWYFKGCFKTWKSSTLIEAKEWIARWATWAQRHPHHSASTLLA